MLSRELKAGVDWVGALDWDRRMFDDLIPLPDGTTYNSYLVRGADKRLADSIAEKHTEIQPVSSRRNDP